MTSATTVSNRSHPPDAPAPAGAPLIARRQCRELLDRLRLLVHFSPRSQRSVEQRAGLRLGHLSLLLRGSLELTFEHALALIHALDFEPEEVFEGLFDQPRTAAVPMRRDGTQALALELAKSYGLDVDSLDELLRRLHGFEIGNESKEHPPSSAGPRSSASLRDG